MVRNYTHYFIIKRAHSASLILNYMYDFKLNFMARSSQVFLFSTNILLIQYIELVCKKMQKLHVPHFSATGLISLNKPRNLIGCCVLVKLSHWLGKGCDLEHEMVRFDNNSH